MDAMVSLETGSPTPKQNGRTGIGKYIDSVVHSLHSNVFYRRPTEARINSVPNFTLPIQHEGQDYTVHFVALFSKKQDAVPLLLLHGWPGNFMEFLSILDILKKRYTPETLPYHIVVPSLPGYAFSSPPPLDRDFQLQDMAAILHSLMVELGFGEGFIVQGGDLGSKTSRVMAATYDTVKAVHSKSAHVMDQ